MFELNAQKFQENVLFETASGELFYYKELNDLSEKILEAVEPRSLVLCLCSNSIGAIAGYIGLSAAHCVPLLLDTEINQQLLAHMILVYKPNYIWRPKGQSIKNIQDKVIITYRDYELITLDNKLPNLHPELGLLLSTSGSTGSPKLVRLSPRNVQTNALSIVQYLNLTQDDRPITSLPFHYTYGLSVINSHFLAGARLLVTNSPVVQREFWNFARSANATSIAGVPYTYEMLLKMRLFDWPLPSLRTLTQAGGRLAKDKIKAYLDYAGANEKEFIVMYGQTEATARMSYLPFKDAHEKLGSVGFAIPGGEFFVVNDMDEPIYEAGITGNLIYTGPNVSMGYAECMEDLQLGDTNCGVLATGDLAYFDKDGYYFITGRKARFAKLFGNRVGLDDIEQILHEYLPTCACVGQDDLVFIYVTEEPLNVNIPKLLSEKTGINQRAFEMKVVPSIPKNSFGKIQYSTLNEETRP